MTGSEKRLARKEVEALLLSMTLGDDDVDGASAPTSAPKSAQVSRHK